MLNSKFIIIFCICICFLFSLSSVSAIDHIDSVDSINNESNIDSVINETNNIDNDYSFYVNVTVKDFKKLNTYIVSNYNSPSEFKGFKNKELLLNFTVFDENRMLVKNGTKVAAYIFSKEYNTTVNSNGEVTIPVVIESIGKFAFEVRYFGNAIYENSRNFTYISIIDEEFESDVNNSENVSLIDNFDISDSSNNQDIITFDNFIYHGVSKKLTFIIPKIEGFTGDKVEVSIYASFDDDSVPNMDLTILFNGIKIPVHCVNGIIKFNLTLPNSSGIYKLEVLFNSTVNNITNKSVITPIVNNISNNSVFNKTKNNNSNNLNDVYNNFNKINMDKTANPIILLIILISSLLIPYCKK